MPASVLHEMPSQCFSGHNGVDELRAMQQVAMELSMLGLTDSSESTCINNRSGTHSYDSSPISEENKFFPNSKTLASSSNTTECVPVPSSEHVAEIVGRQGLLTIFVLKAN